MKTLIQSTFSLFLLCGSQAWAQSYTNFIRQVQYPGETVRDVSVAEFGQRLSELAINPGGARFELWTLLSGGQATPTDYLLDTSYVGAYIPIATVAIRTEDGTGEVPRTRVDRPFFVDVTVAGLLADDDAPEASKGVKFLHHVQSYGEEGTGLNIDRKEATLLEPSPYLITTNGSKSYTFTLNSVPGADRSKVRGEERFSFYSLQDYQAPEAQIASETIQIWPVADGSISGIASNQLIRYKLPQLTLTLNDLYPHSTTYAHVYKGAPNLGTKGTIIAGSAVVVNDSIPQNRVLVLKDYDKAFGSGVNADGEWTMEILTETPFGIDRLAYVTFSLDRTIRVNGSFTTIE